MTTSDNTDHVSVTFKCLNCGADPATLTLPDDHTDDSVAKCKSCGFEFGSYAEVKAKAKEHVLADMRENLLKPFRGRKGWKIK